MLTQTKKSNLEILDSIEDENGVIDITDVQLDLTIPSKKFKVDDLNSNLDRSQFQPGQNFTGGKLKAICSSCMNLKPIEYVFKLGDRLTTIECMDCMSDHF